MTVTGGDATPALFSRSDVADLPPLLIDLGLEEVIEWFNEQMVGAVFDLVEALFTDVLEEMLRLEPSNLSQLEGMYELSMVVYFSLLTLFGLSYLGMFQLFPESQKTDPYRFMSRALAATLSLFIVNPPGSGTLFSQGAFAWAFTISNQTIELFLEGVSFSSDLPSDPVSEAPLDSFGMLVLGLGMAVVVIISEILLFVVLVARQVIVYLTYGLYPLLIVFWVADAGPLKYGKELSQKLFKATGMLIPGGILIAGIFAVGTKFATGTLATFGGGTTTSGVDAAFATTPNPLIQMLMPVMAIAATCILPVMYTFEWLNGTMGGAAGAAVGKAKQGISRGGKGLANKAGISIGGGAGAGSGGITPGRPTSAGAGGGSGSNSGSTLDNIADEPAAVSATQNTLDQYDGGISPDAGGRAEYQEPSLSEADSREAFDRAISDDWSDSQKDDLWALKRHQPEGSVGQGITKETLKAVMGKQTGATAGAALGTVLGPAGTLAGTAIGAGVGWTTQRAVERYGDGVANRIPDRVRTGWGNKVTEVTEKADRFVSDFGAGYDHYSVDPTDDSAEGAGEFANRKEY